jgi:protein CWC15
MTTAGRPTYYARVGQKTAKLNIVSGKDLPAHTKLKYRQSGQNAPSDVEKKDLKAELFRKEGQSSKFQISTETFPEPLNRDVKLLTNVPQADLDVIKKFDDADADDDDRSFDTSRSANIRIFFVSLTLL